MLTAKMSFALSMLLLGSVSLSFQAQSASPRIALVIGNSTYSAAPSLPTPANDAARVAKSLRQLKFDVIEYENADQKTMGEAIKQLRARLEGAGAGAIGFFRVAVMDATHGTQVPWESSSLFGDFYFNDPVQTGTKPH